jgi:malate synthase
MTDRVEVGGLKVATALYDFANAEALVGTGVDPAVFWDGLGAIVRDLAPRNAALIAKRETIQAKIDAQGQPRADRGP